MPPSDTSAAASQIPQLAPLLNLVRKALPVLALSALVVYCLVGSCSVNTGSFKLLHNQLDNMIPEGANVFTALRAAETGHLYRSFRESPYVVQSFGPLFYVFSTGVAHFAHLDMDLTLLHVREITYACYLLSGLCVFLICRKLHCSLAASLLATLMMLGQPDFLGWNVTVRPDMLMLLAMLLSLFLALHMDEWPRIACILSGLFGGLAFLFKQPGAAVVIAIVAVLVLHKEFQKTSLFCAAAAFPVVLAFAGLLWHKEPFWEQYTAVGRCYWSLAEGMRFAGQAALDIVYIVPFFIGLAGFLAALRMGKSWHLIAAFTLFNGLVGLAGLPQPGSNSNYYIPALAGCSLLLPLALQFFQRQSYRALASVLIVPALLYAGYYGTQRNAGYLSFFQGPKGFSYAMLRPYRMISDVPLIGLRGHDPGLLDAFSIHSEELGGSWDSAPVVGEIRQGRFDLIILKHLDTKVVYSPHVDVQRIVPSWRGISDFSPAVVEAINQNYDIHCSSIFSIVLKPKGRSLDISPDYFAKLFGRKCGTGLANKPPNLILRDNAR